MIKSNSFSVSDRWDEVDQVLFGKSPVGVLRYPMLIIAKLSWPSIEPKPNNQAKLTLRAEPGSQHAAEPNPGHPADQ